MSQKNFYGIELFGKIGIPVVYLNPDLTLVSQGYPKFVKLGNFGDVDKVFHNFTYDYKNRRKILSRLKKEAPKDATIAVLGKSENGNGSYPVQFYRMAKPR